MRSDDQDHGRRLRTVVDEVVANTDVHGSLPSLTCAVPSWAAFMVPSSRSSGEDSTCDQRRMREVFHRAKP